MLQLEHRGLLLLTSVLGDIENLRLDGPLHSDRANPVGTQKGRGDIFSASEATLLEALNKVRARALEAHERLTRSPWTRSRPAILSGEDAEVCRAYVEQMALERQAAQMGCCNHAAGSSWWPIRSRTG